MYIYICYITLFYKKSTIDKIKYLWCRHILNIYKISISWYCILKNIIHKISNVLGISIIVSKLILKKGSFLFIDENNQGVNCKYYNTLHKCVKCAITKKRKLLLSIRYNITLIYKEIDLLHLKRILKRDVSFNYCTQCLSKFKFKFLQLSDVYVWICTREIVLKIWPALV